MHYKSSEASTLLMADHGFFSLFLPLSFLSFLLFFSRSNASGMWVGKRNMDCVWFAGKRMRSYIGAPRACRSHCTPMWTFVFPSSRVHHGNSKNCTNMNRNLTKTGGVLLNYKTQNSQIILSMSQKIIETHHYYRYIWRCNTLPAQVDVLCVFPPQFLSMAAVSPHGSHTFTTRTDQQNDDLKNIQKGKPKRSIKLDKFADFTTFLSINGPIIPIKI